MLIDDEELALPYSEFPWFKETLGNKATNSALGGKLFGLNLHDWLRHGQPDWLRFSSSFPSP
ncbi:hypothetical protein KBY95_16115, partial [Cyanobium sp. Aljojuca 7A6]|nr:hypothetical protein [Cyanobium sp. Aljojuca 7A6]